MNYAELVKAIKAYSENTFPNTTGSGGLTSDEQIAIFVDQAEQRIYNSVQLLVERNYTSLTAVIGNPLVAYPTDWLAGISLACIDPDTGEYTYLLNKDVEFIREAYPDPADTGAPQFYAFYNSTQYILGPTPDAAYSLPVTYYKYPTSIVSASTTWLGDNCDSALLYGALLEAATFMKSEKDVVDQLQARYNEALALLKQLAEGKNRQDNYRTGVTRAPVR